MLEALEHRLAGRRTAHLLPVSRSLGRQPSWRWDERKARPTALASSARTRSSTWSCSREARLRGGQAPRRRDPRAAHDLIKVRDRERPERWTPRACSSRRLISATTSSCALPRPSARRAAGPGADALDPGGRLARAPYYDPPAKERRKPKLVGHHPCVGVRHRRAGRAPARSSHLCRRRLAPARPSSASARTDSRAIRRSRPR